jgi:hypothetical protein
MEFKIGDVLAICTLIGGVVSYTVSNVKDRELKTAEHAEKVRSSAAQMLGKTRAVRDAIPISVLEAKQQVVQTKLRLLARYEPDKELHDLWGKLLDVEAKNAARLASLQVDPAYLAVFTYSPGTKRCMDLVVAQVSAELGRGFEEVRAAVEASRLELRQRPRSKYAPAALYNKVAYALDKVDSDAMTRIGKIMAPVDTHLIGVIGRDNNALVAESLQKERIDCGAPSS